VFPEFRGRGERHALRGGGHRHLLGGRGTHDNGRAAAAGGGVGAGGSNSVTLKIPNFL
jgi:hypothetical protein